MPPRAWSKVPESWSKGSHKKCKQYHNSQWPFPLSLSAEWCWLDNTRFSMVLKESPNPQLTTLSGRFLHSCFKSTIWKQGNDCVWNISQILSFVTLTYSLRSFTHSGQIHWSPSGQIGGTMRYRAVRVLAHFPTHCAEFFKNLSGHLAKTISTKCYTSYLHVKMWYLKLALEKLPEISVDKTRISCPRPTHTWNETF